MRNLLLLIGIVFQIGVFTLLDAHATPSLSQSLHGMSWSIDRGIDTAVAWAEDLGSTARTTQADLARGAREIQRTRDNFNEIGSALRGAR